MVAELDTFRVRVDLVVTSSGPKLDVADFSAQIRSGLRELSYAADVAGAATSADFRVWMIVPQVSSGLAAARQASAALRTAVHKAGVQTPNWPSDAELPNWLREDEVWSQMVPAGAAPVPADEPDAVLV